MNKKIVNDIPFDSKLKNFTNIKNRNRAFSKLTRVEKAREVAYDALTLLLKGKIRAKSGIYWGNKLTNIRKVSDTPAKFQEKLCNIQTGCDVCARGALMLSTIRLGNSIDPKEQNVPDGNRKLIKGKGFGFDTFKNMEKEFEGWFGGCNLNYESGTNEKLALILCNVIKNGTFRKNDRTDYVELWNLEL